MTLLDTSELKAVILQVTLEVASTRRWVPMVFLRNERSLCICFWPPLYRMQREDMAMQRKTSRCMLRSFQYSAAVICLLEVKNTVGNQKNLPRLRVQGMSF
jgi:hypothetical protein